MSTAKKQEEPTVIKKYANRRLYDTGRSSYVTLDDLCQLVKEGHEFVVYDAKSGEDLTRSVLTQIIVDQESKGGQNLLPIGFLRQLIGFYGDNIGSLIPNYLEHSIQTFSKNQERLRDHINKSIEGMFPIPNIDEINKKNMEMFENTMRAFSPFTAMTRGTMNGVGMTAATASKTAPADGQKAAELKKNIEAMQRELDRLSGQA